MNNRPGWNRPRETLLSVVVLLLLVLSHAQLVAQ